MRELDARKFSYEAVWDKLLNTDMDILDDDTIGSVTFKHNQFEYHGIYDNYPLTSIYKLDNKQLSEVWSFLVHITISVSNTTRFLVKMTTFTRNRPYCLYYHSW